MFNYDRLEGLHNELRQKDDKLRQLQYTIERQDRTISEIQSQLDEYRKIKAKNSYIDFLLTQPPLKAHEAYLQNQVAHPYHILYEKLTPTQLKKQYNIIRGADALY